MNKTEKSPNVKQPLYQFEEAGHNNKPVIFICFVYDPKLNSQVKKLKDVKWSRTKKAWYVPDNPQYRKQFGLQPKPLGKEVLAHIHPQNQPAL